MTCPPPPPEPVEVHADAPTVALPAPTLRWLAYRDVYADEVTACYLDAAGRLDIAQAEADALRLDVAAVSTDLQHATERAEGWERIARRRPSWGVLVGAVLVVGAGSVVTWEAVR